MSYFTAATTAAAHCFVLEIRDVRGETVFTNGAGTGAFTLFEQVHEFSAAAIADEDQALRYEYRELIDEYDNTGQAEDERFENQRARTCVVLTESLLEMIADAHPQWQITAHAKRI